MKESQKSKVKSQKAGFTLVETLVAVAILTIALSGPFFAIQQSLVASYVARDNLIAASLAQEAIEFIRSIRDDNYLYNLAHPGSPRSWLYGLDGSGGVDCQEPKMCAVDPGQNETDECAGTCAPLYESSGHVYNQQESGTVTRFTRSVSVEMISDHEALVTVSLTWKTGHLNESITLTTTLQDWL